MPVLLFLVLIQWMLVCAGGALFWRWRNPWRISPILLEMIAPLLLVGAFAGIWLMPPAARLENWRMLLMLGLLPVLFCWGRLALLPAAPRGNRRINQIWSWVTALTHLCLFAVACWWLAAWFVEQRISALRGAPNETQWMALTMIANRLAGALLLGGALAGALEAARARAANPARIAGLANWMLTLIVWRAIAIGLSIALAIVLDPAWWAFFLKSLLQAGGWLLFLRMLLGLILPGVHALLAMGMAQAEPGEALQQFPPALVMILIGEALGAAMTMGMLGLGF